MNIKFRAWHKEYKIMYPVRELCWSHTKGKNFDWIELGEALESITCEDKNIELMQWTGWYDQNKSPIFHGDILDCGCGDGIGRMWVQWNDDKCMFCFMWIGEPWDWHEFDEYTENDLLIIGNIYENPELLNAT